MFENPAALAVPAKRWKAPRSTETRGKDLVAAPTLTIGKRK
jgi:hypothetical protein